MKEFIQNNREAFDASVPGAHGWEGLQRMLDRLPHADRLEKQLMCERIWLDTEEPGPNVWAGIEKQLVGAVHSNSLESFIRAHREEFDHAAPPERLWHEIAGELPKPTVKVRYGGHWQRNLFRAAAAVALLVTGIGAGIWFERSNGTQPQMAMSQVSAEYAELEQYFQRDITTKTQKLASIRGSQPAEVRADLEQLDKAMEELRLELANVPPGNREQVVRAMIENYQAKLIILKRVLERLDDTQNGGDNRTLSNGIKNI
jgi:hypothetical protein